MNIKKVYYKCIDKLNKLVSNNQQDITFEIFIQNINEAQLHFVRNCLKVEERNKTEIDNLQQILVLEKELHDSKRNELFYSFELPDNYLHYSSSFTKIKVCPYLLENNLVESANIVDFSKNANAIPSIRFEETMVIIANNKLAVYYNEEFTPDSVLLNYYRKPIEANMENGFSDFDGNKNIDIDLEWSDTITEEIIDLCVQQISSNYSDEYRRQTIDAHIKETQIRL